MRQNIAVVATVITAAFLMGCDGSPSDESSTASSPSPTETPEPTEETVTTIAIGEEVSLNEADLTVDSVEEVESFDTECGDSYAAPDDQSLHAIAITTTNTSDDIQYPDGQYIGGESVTFRDSDEREMQFAHPGCKLEGEETFDGLMPGKTKSRPLLVEGATRDSRPGWIELAPSFDAEPVAILLDEDLELTRSPG